MTAPSSPGGEQSLPAPPLRVIFRGRVQGVGFRFTTRRLAGGFQVTGAVRNLPDGSVELCVDGSPGEVARFLAAIESRMDGCIDTREISPLTDSSGFSGFQIVR